MAWTHSSKLVGKLYIPDFQAALKKHACPDCFACQHCGDERCVICLVESGKKAVSLEDMSFTDDTSLLEDDPA